MDYGISQDMDADDHRHPKWRQQREERGFDDTETWNLDHTLAQFMIPRLQRFKEVSITYPHSLTPEEWNSKIDEMINAFQLMIRDTNGEDLSREQYEQINHGINVFARYLRDLWW